MHAPATLDVATVDTLPDTLAAPAPPEPQAVPADVQPRWNLATRIGFRFSFLYFSLYVVMTQMLGGLLPFQWMPNPGGATFMQRIVSWVGVHVFRLGAPPSFQIRAAATSWSTTCRRSPAADGGRRGHGDLVGRRSPPPELSRRSTSGSGCSCGSPSARR